MKLKTVEIDGTTYAAVADGKPVFITDDGKEAGFDVPEMSAKIRGLNGEAQANREAKQAAEAALRQFEGITDPAAAIKALATMKNLDDKKLVDAGDVERVKAEAIKAVEDKYRPVVEERDGLQAALRAEKIGGSFARSKFIADKIAIPADLIEAQFGQNFTLEDGRIVAKDARGNHIYSQTRPGELADFDEALEALVGQYQYKDRILKGTGNSGGGARGGSDGGAPGAKTMSRSQFDAISKSDPAEASRLMTSGGVTITD